jgi:NAD-dependent dihydropyrimidine dehydrogenase PreA subunit
MDREAVWIDVARCTGCGECVSICPVAAIALADGKARIDEATCTGCGACVRACPEGAIQPVVQGELMAPEKQRPPVTRRPQPLAQGAVAGLAVAALGALMRVGGAIARAVGWYWGQRPTDLGAPTRSSIDNRTGTSTPRDLSAGVARGGGGGGHRARHRHRGG